MYRLYRVTAIVIVLSLLLVAGRSVRTSRAESTVSKIAPWVLENTADGAEAEFLVVMGSQADLRASDDLLTKVDKGRYVYETLWETAQASQKPLLAWLEARGIQHRAYYIVNLVWVQGDANLALTLAARPDVARIEGNPRVQNALPEPTAPLFPTPDAAPDGIETGIAYSRAPEVWSMGYTGEGLVVGGQDTGYDWTHPTLQPHYRGWDGVTANHDYNWHDAIHTTGSSCGADSPVPCDDHSHGTHTMGTVVGDDGGTNQIGMAPGAQWIGCRNMDSGIGTPSTYLECFEFFLAPYPVDGTSDQGDPDKAPDVTNNSWTCPPSEGCSWDILQAAVEAQRAAGIMTVVSASNSGSSCSTVDDPPAIYAAAYTVGALSTGTDTIWSGSSRGPVTVDGSNRRKPDLAAPGTGVRSCMPNGGYGFKTGTSMASPHVVGAVALLWSASPAYKNQIPMTEQLLNDNAVHIASSACSSSGWPNNVYGYGRLDVKAAVDAALALPPVYGVAIAPESLAQSGDPGEVVPATFTVTNTGNQMDTFTVTLSGGTWNADAAAVLGPLDAGTDTALPVTVTVPADALADAVDAQRLTVTSQGNPSQAITATLTTMANAVYSVTLAPPWAAQSGDAGTTVTHPLTLTNTGNVVDTYALSLVGGVWPMTLAPESATLLPGENAPVTVTVDVPAETLVGAMDTVRVVASGTGISASSALTTAADCLPVSGARFSYVPPSLKVGQMVTFTGAVDIGTPPVTYTWDFGDGAGAAGRVVTHTFPVESVMLSYTVTMTATNGCGSDVDRQDVTVALYEVYLPVVVRK